MRISDWSSDVCSSDLDDGRFQFAAAHHFVEREAELVALAEADPADARGQALELDAFAGHVEPVVQVLVVGDQFLDLGVGLVDVLGVAAERDPAERADRSEEHTSELQSLMRISYAVFCLKKKKIRGNTPTIERPY